MVSRETSADDLLGQAAADFRYDPLGFVMFWFPWDSDGTIQQVPFAEGVEDEMTDADRRRRDLYRKRFPMARFGPDLWACDFLTEWGMEMESRQFNGIDAVAPLQFATVSGHGIGKSTLTAWIILFIMNTRPNSKGTITANTADQLRTKTWAELGKWHRRSISEHWFDYNTGRGSMTYKAKSRPEEWFCTAQTCREENSEAFAGQHSASATSFYVFDEASNVPDKIYEVREGGTVSGEPMTFDFGNGTRNSGRFFEECEGRLRHRYIRRSIDSRTVHITNKHRIKEWVTDFGDESDFVKVRVRGMFPAIGNRQFMPSNLVAAAQRRELVRDPHAPLLIGVDVARGDTDESVIYPRIGWDARSFPARRFTGLNGIQLANQVARYIDEFAGFGHHDPHIFIDVTGGSGASPYDHLQALGYNPIAVNFGAGAVNKQIYRYKSDELWGDLRDGLDKLCLPTDETGRELFEQLTQREFDYLQSGHVHLERKKDMKARLGRELGGSPDIADALACTFFMPVAPLKRAWGDAPGGKAVHEYDPLSAD